MFHLKRSILPGRKQFVEYVSKWNIFILKLDDKLTFNEVFLMLEHRRRPANNKLLSGSTVAGIKEKNQLLWIFLKIKQL